MLYACLACLALMAGLFAVSGAAGAAQAQDPKPQVILETSQGTITLELDRARAPITVANFLRYVDSGQYNGTIFHRVIPGFMIQGGGFTEAMREKPTRDPIKNESGNGLSNVRGAVAMARTNDPDSATAQFFINHADNRPLDTSGGGYAVFGRVIDGMDVVDKIAAEPTAFKSGMKDVPVRPIVIQKASRKPKG